MAIDVRAEFEDRPEDANAAVIRRLGTATSSTVLADMPQDNVSRMTRNSPRACLEDGLARAGQAQSGVEDICYTASAARCCAAPVADCATQAGLVNKSLVSLVFSP